MRAMQKVKPFRSKRYLKLVAGLPCVICHDPETVAHHIKGKDYGGMGLKAPDDYVFPMCHVCHSELHNKGYRHFESIHGHQVDYVRRTNEQLSEHLKELKK